MTNIGYVDLGKGWATQRPRMRSSIAGGLTAPIFAVTDRLPTVDLPGGPELLLIAFIVIVIVILVRVIIRR